MFDILLHKKINCAIFCALFFLSARSNKNSAEEVVLANCCAISSALFFLSARSNKNSVEEVAEEIVI